MLIQGLLNEIVHSEEPLEAALQRSLQKICSPEAPVGARAGAVFYAQGEELRLAAQYHVHDQLERYCGQLAPGQCLCGRVAVSRQPLSCTGVDERHEIRYQPMSDHGHVILPLISRGALVGVLNLQTDPGYVADGQEQGILEAIANILALAIAQFGGDGDVAGRLSAVAPGNADPQADRFQQAFQFLSETARHALSAQSEGHFIEALAQTVADVGGYDAVWLGLLANTFLPPMELSGERLFGSTAQVGFSAKCSTLLPSRGKSGPQVEALLEVLQAAKPYVVEEAADCQLGGHWRALLEQGGWPTLCILPLVHHRETVGIMAVPGFSADTFTPARIAMLRDVVDLAACEIKYRRTAGERDLLATANEQIPESVFVTDPDGYIVYANPAFERQTGFSRDEVLGRKPSMLKSGLMPAAFYKRLWATLNRGESFNAVFTNRHKGGTLLYEEKYLTPIKNRQGKITHYISTGRDITDRHHLERQLERLAYHDPLTDLPNRRFLLKKFDQLTRSGAIGQGQQAAILFIDINDFKIVNDALGHAAGDRLLECIADRLKRTVRDHDDVARQGGDEFIVLMRAERRHPRSGAKDTQVSEPQLAEDASALATRIIQVLRRPFVLDGLEHRIGASIGISLFPYLGSDPETVISQADAAMYRAKKSGNRIALYSPDTTAVRHRRLSLEGRLYHALEHEEFCLHYQPIWAIDSARILGVEALLRWTDADGRRLSPGEFIPLAEEIGLIDPIGEWVFATAAEQLVRWREAGLPLTMSVNLAVSQLAEPEAVAKITNLATRGGAKPGWWCLEVTENLFMHDAETVERTMHSLSERGFGFALDDFGRGYSSLARLKSLPLDTLKIDKIFVDELETNAQARSIVAAIIEMAEHMSMRSLAEGVETDRQREILQQLGCDSGQGFWLSAARPPEEISTLVERFGCRV